MNKNKGKEQQQNTEDMKWVKHGGNAVSQVKKETTITLRSIYFSNESVINRDRLQRL